MFGKGKDKGHGHAHHRRAKIDTLIGQNTELVGDVRFTGGLHVDGRIKGNVISDQDDSSLLSLSERGFIEGEVRVPNVVLNGTVKGDVYVSHHLELAANARVSGNVYYTVIEMALGAEVNGNLVHMKKEDQKQPASVPRPEGAAAKSGATDKPGMGSPAAKPPGAMAGTKSAADS